MILHEFNIAILCCSEDVGLAHDARRRRRLRNTEGVCEKGGGGGGWGMRQLLAARFPPESAAGRVNENKHCAIFHKLDRTCNLPK